ncbi:Pre-mRNA-processing factor 17 [Trichinella spiralis]|uniref:Pre-mRNA-processing factor 17 n=1 Tax=Trichinella spiralis TaxID=6334 RepID=UPI0001EFD706|nr:Pre-mRNA-processing factor 17 [Trichinella spiralis]
MECKDSAHQERGADNKSLNALECLQNAYNSSSDEQSDDGIEQHQVEKGSFQNISLHFSKSKGTLVKRNLAPELPYENNSKVVHVVDLKKELQHNACYDEIFLPLVNLLWNTITSGQGPSNPFKSAKQQMLRNTLTGFVEPAHINDFNFENERRTFESYGYAKDPTADVPSDRIIGDVESAAKYNGLTAFESGKRLKETEEKREKLKNYDSSDVQNFTGPWAPYVGEQRISAPDAETMLEIEEMNRKRKKIIKMQKSEMHEPERSLLHSACLKSVISDTVDYQGRTFMCAPHDEGVNLRADAVPERCYIPKKLIHTWTGHKKGVQLWEVYRGRRCIRTYMGHRMAVRDLSFNNAGTQFLSTSYDRTIKLWDTETGQCKERFTPGKVAYCVKFNPDDDKQDLFICGMQDKKAVQYDLRSGEIVQEYDRHLGAVNTVTFFDKNRRFCTTSDDKSMRIWEWGIPVDTKLIQDPGMYSMPAVTMSPNEKWLACQAMDNRVVIFQVVDDKIRFCRKKCFRGHIVAGYACSVDFSSDISYLLSGDSDGKIFLWDWKTRRIVARWKAHDGVCMSVLWHPHESSKVASCGWDGTIKFWD